MDLQTGIDGALQTAAPNLNLVMLILSVFGLPEFYLVVIPLILWCFDKKLGLRLIFLLSISNAINSMLKILFHTPRPYWTSMEVKGMASEPTFGMPSGHAQISLGFLGYIAARVHRTSIWIVSGILILLVGISRMYLGVHFLSDVLAGWLVGILILVVFIRYEDPFADWFGKKTAGFRVLLAFGSSVVLILLTGAVIAALGSWQIPPEWNARALEQTGAAINPVSLQDTLLSAGLLFGAASGAILSAEFMPYSVDGSTIQKFLRVVVGLVILLGIWVVLGPFTRSPGSIGFGMTYARAAAGGIWITLGAPVLFRKSRLAGGEPAP